MIEWIIFGGVALIISEILFLVRGDEEEWLCSKILFLLMGSVVSGLLFLVPYLFAYKCELFLSRGVGSCVNHGLLVFYWLYGIIIGVVLFFLINGWLIKKIRTNEKGKKKSG